MKAITLYQPWACLVAAGFKEVETRSWYTPYRGPLAIHAGKARTNPEDVSRITFALGAHGFEVPALHFGAVLCVVDLVACLPAAYAHLKARQLKPGFQPRRGWPFEHLFGDYTTGRWAWILKNPRVLDRPAPAIGSRKLWEWEPK